MQALEKVSGSNGEIVLRTDKEEIIENGWNLLGPYWAAVETPTNYFFTMTTLLHYIKQERVKPGAWLSLGSGPGIYETYLSKQFPYTHVTSIDIAQSMVDFHTDLKNRFAGNQTLICANIEKLPQKDQSCDLVIVNNSIQWMGHEGAKNTVSEIKRVLKKNGYLFLIVHPHSMRFLATNTEVEEESVAENKGVTGDEVFEWCKEVGLDAIGSRSFVARAAGQMGNDSVRTFYYFKK
jgi:ubiquinone/menaquinone biosynthesis C-methylase UbiE